MENVPTFNGKNCSRTYHAGGHIGVLSGKLALALPPSLGARLTQNVRMTFPLFLAAGELRSTSYGCALFPPFFPFMISRSVPLGWGNI